MKAILLAGGKGTRLRPLTIHTPKPIVPIFDRAFLHYQIDLLKQVPEIDEVILSLNYQPRRIEEIFGDGTGTGVRIRYVVEPAPLGTGGAIRFAAQGVTDTIVVFNGDVMTSVDVNHVVALHREREAKATIVLTPVDNPSAYGLVETQPGRRGPTLPRKAERGRDHLRHDQRRHLRARAGHLRSHSQGRVVFDRARLLSVAGRARRAVLRLRRSRLLDRHRHAGEIRPGAPRHVRRPVRRRRLRVRRSHAADRRARRADRGRRASSQAPCFVDSGAQIKAGADDRPVLGHRPRRGRRGRSRGQRTASSGPTRASASTPSRGRDPRAATATSAATSSSAAPPCSATRPR